MSKEMISYLKDVADATIQHMLTVQSYEPAISVDFGAAARVYLTNIGFVLANRPDLIEDSELRTKLGFSGQMSDQQHQEDVAEQEHNKTEEEVEVTLDPSINAEELRVLLTREIIHATRLNDTDAREFATYLMEMDQFKSTLNTTIDERSSNPESDLPGSDLSDVPFGRRTYSAWCSWRFAQSVD